MGMREKLKELEDELARTQKNKKTEYHIGIIKSKIAQLRRELVAPRKHGASGGGFDVRKSGDATVVMIGLPSVGKSTLLNSLTKAQSQIAAYAFTTLKCIPGILEYGGARIQVLDLPGIIEGAKDGKGRGREIIAVARNADLILMLVEANVPAQVKVLESELHGFGIRINSKPPHVVIKKTEKNGVIINSTVKLTKITKKEIKAALAGYSLFNADVVLREDVDIDRFIDVLEGNRAYVPALKVATKCDLVPKEKLAKLKGFVKVSAEKGDGIADLKKGIYDALKFIRIFTKRRGEHADLEEPLIVTAGTTVEGVCYRLHRQLRKEFKYALVWGKSAKYPGQRVGLAHMLKDGDVVQIVKK